MKRYGTIVLTVLFMMLVGCASSVPKAIRQAPAGNPSVTEVRAEPTRFLGSQVRWGGTIEAVENKSTETWLEVVSRPLEGDGRPKDTDKSEGRFMAKMDGFYDPAIYAVGRKVTVTGRLVEPVSGEIGKHPYQFPVVDVQTHYLWPREQNYRGVYDPFWYDPWYPYYRPYGPWPYYW